MNPIVRGAVWAGVTILAATSVRAGVLTGVSTGGTAPTDYTVYGVIGVNLAQVQSTLSNAEAALSGNSASPTGNVELRSGSELLGFDFSKNTTLAGVIGGQSITLSSLTAGDWNGLYKSTGKTLFDYWFDLFCDSACSSNADRADVRSGFLAALGQQRFSDPNISYVRQDDGTGTVRIGLAGNLNLRDAFSDPASPFNSLVGQLKNSFQASELVKYTYEGKTDYLFSFSATPSGLTLASGDPSFSGNYEVMINGVPEPSSILLIAIGLVGVAASGAGPRVRRTRQ